MFDSPKIPKKETEIPNVKSVIDEFLNTDLAGKGKVGQILKDIKEGKTGLGAEKVCTTCGKGHVHTVPDNKVVGKCTDCGEEFMNVSTKDAPYECKDCHTPHFRPLDKTREKEDKCPNCGKDEFIERHKH